MPRSLLDVRLLLNPPNKRDGIATETQINEAHHCCQSLAYQYCRFRCAAALSAHGLGPALFWTYQVAPGNIAQKGIAVRLDDGPGGVSKGRAWMVCDTAGTTGDDRGADFSPQEWLSAHQPSELPERRPASTPLRDKSRAPFRAGRPYFVMELVRGIRITDGATFARSLHGTIHQLSEK